MVGEVDFAVPAGEQKVNTTIQFGTLVKDKDNNGLYLQRGLTIILR